MVFSLWFIRIVQSQGHSDSRSFSRIESGSRRWERNIFIVFLWLTELHGGLLFLWSVASWIVNISTRTRPLNSSAQQRIHSGERVSQLHHQILLSISSNDPQIVHTNRTFCTAQPWERVLMKLAVGCCWYGLKTSANCYCGVKLK